MPTVLESMRLLSDPIRVRLLLLLSPGEELSVAELQEILGMGQSRISSHLAQLKRANLVKDRRVGKKILYGMAEHDAHSRLWPQVEELLQLSAKEIPERKQDQTSLRVTLQKRRDTTRAYFNELAGKFGKSYCPGRTWRGLSHLLLSLLPEMTIADLGAGEGTLSQLLAKKAKKVIAVDNSEKMVDYGAALAKKHGFNNLEYRRGDIEDPPIEPESVDLVIFSQALHHANSPPKAIAAAARILKPGGRIAILDLLSHHMEEARDLYADLWLGFSEADLLAMLEDAGMEEAETMVVSKDPKDARFQTVFATGQKPFAAAGGNSSE